MPQAAGSRCIPGTADADHLEANIAVGAITLDEHTTADLDTATPRPAEVTSG